MNDKPPTRRGRELTPEQRGEILALIAEGMSQRDIARRYGISKSTVSGIAFRARHGHEYRRNRPQSDRRRLTLNDTRLFKQIKPAKAPYAPDSSCPDFAHDGAHCDAVHSARAAGFPALRWR